MDRFWMDVADKDGDSSAVVTVSGEIDLAVADKMGQALDRLIGADLEVSLDCSAVTFMDSTGLKTLVRARQEADNRAGAAFRLVAASEAVLRVLDLAGLAALFDNAPAAPRPPTP